MLKVSLVDILGDLWLHDVQLSSECQEVVVEVYVGHDLQQVFGILPAVSFLLRHVEEELLSAEHEGKLLADHTVGALCEDLPHEGGVPQHHSRAQSQGVLVEALVDLQRRGQEEGVLRLRHVLHTAGGGGSCDSHVIVYTCSHVICDDQAIHVL